jgi:hypothetical protein
MRPKRDNANNPNIHLKYALHESERKLRKITLNIVDKYENYTSENIKLHGTSLILQVFCCVKVPQDPEKIFKRFSVI